MHELVCPRFTHDHTPCNFEVSYLPPRFLESKQIRMKHMYSYVVLKKGAKRKTQIISLKVECVV